MSDTPFSMDRIQIASPCPQDWEGMTGDNQVRFCNQCQLNVYNFTDMTPEAVEALIREKEGNICARIFRREDGMMMTQDCPVGLQAVRWKLLKLRGAIAATLLGLLTTFGVYAATSQNNNDIHGEYLTGNLAPSEDYTRFLNPAPGSQTVKPFQTEITDPQVDKEPPEGEVIDQTQEPPVKPLPKDHIMGKVRMDNPTPNEPPQTN